VSAPAAVRDTGRTVGRSLAARWGLERPFLVALARAFAGAVLFGLPLLMTMEMWSLGFSIRPWRLALFVGLSVPLLTGLAYYSGFREDVGWRDALIDAGVAYLVGLVATASVLMLLAVLEPGLSPAETIGKVALQAIPAGMGATLARSQLGLREDDAPSEARRETYGGELFLMAAGGLFFAFNVAPTDEIVLIAHQQSSPILAVATVAASVLVLHAFVYSLGFRGQHRSPEQGSGLAELVRLTVPGYGLVLLVSAYLLWTFGRLDGLGANDALHLCIVLSFPGVLGAATARLVL
jgi:putative integral membrane protein (TIGR02587 family)